MHTQVLRWRRVSVATVTAMLLVAMMGTLAAVPTEAARGITFNVYLGSYCVDGRAANNAGVSVIWKDSDGDLKQSGFKRANKKGYWEYCGKANFRFVYFLSFRSNVFLNFRDIFT